MWNNSITPRVLPDFPDDVDFSDSQLPEDELAVVLKRREEQAELARKARLSYGATIGKGGVLKG